jgi:hypothetical protein
MSAGPATDHAQANEEHDLPRRIAGLLDGPERRAQMGAVGREHLRTKLAWEHSVLVLLAAYHQLLPGRNIATNGATYAPVRQQR